MNNKQIIAVGSVAILVIMVALGWWLLSPSWVSLYAVEITDADKNNVMAALSEAAVEHKYDDATKKILVHPEDVNKANSFLNARGIPQKNGVGLEMFNSSDYGLSEFVQNVNYQRAMEEELVRSIRLIKGIKDARVHLTIKKQSIFEERKEESKASVLLSFQDDAIVDKNLIRGVQEITAAAIPSLSPEAIVILADDGRVLSSKADDAGGADSNLLEQKYHHSVTKLLSSYLGDGVFTVSVDLKIDRKKKVTVAENYIPDSRTGKGFLIKSKQSEKKTDNESQLTTGQNQNQRDEEFVFSKEKSEIVYPVGGIEKISVGIVVQRDITPNEQKALRELIFNALGMDAARGDVVSLVTVTAPFKPQVEPPKAETPAAPRSILDLRAPTGEHTWVDEYRYYLFIAFGIVVFALCFAVVLLMSSKKQTHEKLSPLEREKLIADLKEWMR